MTKEEKFRFQQTVLDGGQMDQAQFQHGMNYLLPAVKDGAISRWAEFARECVDMQQYVKFEEVPEAESLCRWYDTLLAGFVLLTEQFGKETATKVCDLSLDNCCLYPYEMERAAEALQRGASLDDLFSLMKEGKLDADTPVFPNLQEVLNSNALTSSTQMNLSF